MISKAKRRRLVRLSGIGGLLLGLFGFMIYGDYARTPIRGFNDLLFIVVTAIVITVFNCQNKSAALVVGMSIKSLFMLPLVYRHMQFPRNEVVNEAFARCVMIIIGYGILTIVIHVIEKATSSTVDHL